MNTINITLSEESMDWVRRQAADRGFPDESDYLRRLIEAMRKADELDAGNEEDFGAAEACTFHNIEELESMLRDGLESGPATEMTEQDWRDIRREVADRTARRQGA